MYKINKWLIIITSIIFLTSFKNQSRTLKTQNEYCYYFLIYNCSLTRKNINPVLQTHLFSPIIKTKISVINQLSWATKVEENFRKELLEKHPEYYDEKVFNIGRIGFHSMEDYKSRYTDYNVIKKDFDQQKDSYSDDKTWKIVDFENYSSGGL